MATLGANQNGQQRRKLEVTAHLREPAVARKKRRVAPAGLFSWLALEIARLITHPTARIAHRAKTHTSGALRRVKHELELVGHPAEFWKRTGLHLLHSPAAMH